MNKELINWIKEQRVGPFTSNCEQPTFNVFLADFIDLKNSEFCRTVIQLNSQIQESIDIGKKQGNNATDNENEPDE